jgi:hypothetical protein
MVMQTGTSSTHATRQSGRKIVESMDRLNEYDICIDPVEAAQFLMRSAVEYGITFCTAEICPVCEDFVLTWHSVYAALPKNVQEVLDAKVERGDFLPPQRREGGY